MKFTTSIVRTVLQPIAAAILLAILVRLFVHVYEIPSDSMLPTLLPGDRILVVRYLGGEPRRGDIVVFESPGGTGELLVKRIVAGPGDLVDSRMGRLRVGGYTVPEPYLQQQAATGEIQSQVVPPGCVFVMGDNREISLDSRSRGAMPETAIVGRARLILWSARRPSPARAPGEPAGAGVGPVGRAPGIRLFKRIE